MADFSKNKEVLEMMRALDPEERAKMYQEYSARGIQLPSDQDEFDAVTSSPLFQQLDDDSRKKLYSSYGRTYAAPQGAAMKKSLSPSVVSDASATVGGALSGLRMGRLPGAALGALGGFLANRGIQKVTGTEPEAATASNVLSLNPFGKGALVNAAMRGGEAAASAGIDNIVKMMELKKIMEQDPERGQRLANSPANNSADWRIAGAVGTLGGAIPGALSNAAGSQYARRVAANQGVQEGLEDAAQKLKPALSTVDQRVIQGRTQKPTVEAAYDEVLEPLFKAKTKEKLPDAVDAMKLALDKLSTVAGAKGPEVQKGLGKRFIERLIEESGNGKFANPESLILRMDEIGKKTFDTIIGTPGAFESFKKLAGMAASQKSHPSDALILTKWGPMIRAGQKIKEKFGYGEPLGKDKEQLSRLPVVGMKWDEMIEKWAKPRRVNLLSPGNQRFTRRAIDFEAEEASESSEPLVPRL